MHHHVQLVDDLANRLFKAGRIKDLCQSEGFYTRLTAIERQFPSASVLMHKGGVLPRAVQRSLPSAAVSHSTDMLQPVV